MSFTWTKSGIPLETRLASIRVGNDLIVGVVGPKAKESHGRVNNAQLAAIHEFGNAHVPGRHFVARGFLASRKEATAIVAAGIRRVLEGKDTKAHVLELVGRAIARKMQDFLLLSGKHLSPPLKPSTVYSKRAKGYWDPSRPVRATGRLFKAISWEVRSTGNGK